MSTFRSRTPHTADYSIQQSLSSILDRFSGQRSVIFGAISVVALMSFEIFNYSTTEYALTDLLGDLSFAGLHWAAILALAFCGIDFAGIARLFSPDRGKKEPVEVWYLLGAWFLGATMNAMLTWWAVSLALLDHVTLGNEVVGREALLSGVPIFVAVLVWLIRVLMIGSFTVSGDRLNMQDQQTIQPRNSVSSRAKPALSRTPVHAIEQTRASRPVNPAPKPVRREEPRYVQPPMVARPPRRK